ncbi:hypothetical protein [Streptomyces sp. NPDC052036]|uniref:hypothetical protein n=1 Tax=Streptomyces sp. NPDC052036 TaxID=3155171 RepID=UPI0034384E45
MSGVSPAPAVRIPMNVLADARPDELDPSRLVDPARQREDLARIIAGATDGRAAHLLAPRRRRSGFRPLEAAALAAVAASVVAVSTLDRQEPAEPATAPPRSSAGTEGTGAGADIRVDGHLELLSAARKAATSVAEGTYWQTTTRSVYVDVGGEKGQLFAVRSTSTDEWSVGVRPGTRSLMVSGLHSVTEPRTAADEARWHAAGSPGTVRVGVANQSGTGAIGYTMGTRPPMVMRTNIDDKIYAVGPRNVSYKDLRALPATSGELRRYLERLYAADNGAETSASGHSAWILRRAADLVTMPVKPGVRAAAYRAGSGCSRGSPIPWGARASASSSPRPSGRRWGAPGSNWSWTRRPAPCSAKRSCWSNRRPGRRRRDSTRARR